MRLTLLEASRPVKNGMHDGRAYEVNGLPAGEHATIAYFNQAWRILRWNDEWHGNWAGAYATCEAALECLREELLSVASR